MGYYIGTAKRVRQTRKAPLQLKKHNYFNFAEGKREAEDEEEEELKPKAKEQPHLLGAREREQEEVAKRASE
jgi:hypothetical protein